MVISFGSFTLENEAAGLNLKCDTVDRINNSQTINIDYSNRTRYDLNVINVQQQITNINVTVNEKEKKPSYLEKSMKNVKELWKDEGTYDKIGTHVINTLFSIAEDPKHIDVTGIAFQTVQLAVNLYASCFGLGGISDALFNSIANFGEHPQSELQKLQAHMDEQFEELNDHLDEIQDDISMLSKTVDNSTAEIIDAISFALDKTYAKQKVSDFLSSGNGNFNYKQFKNYLFGGADSTYDSTQTFYYNLQKAIVKKYPAEVIEESYCNLYNSLMSSFLGESRINILYDYLLGNEVDETIQHYYFDWILSSDNFPTDKNPVFEALQFTSDLINTAVFADYCISACNKFFLFKIYEEYGTNLEGKEYVTYENGNVKISYEQLCSIEKDIEERQNALFNQIVNDIAYFYNLEGSVTIKDSNNDIRIMTNDDETTFGKVHIGQSICLNKLPNNICDLYLIDKDKFTYKWIGDGKHEIINDGSYKVDAAFSKIKAIVYYGDVIVYSIDFDVLNDDSTSFNGGDGSEENPYIIYNEAQFNSISSLDNGMNMHYKLINDLDFKLIPFKQIGSEDKPFNGSFDGNGYSIKNVTGEYAEYAGIFGYIGQYGEVLNLIVQDCDIKINSNNYEKVYAGAIAAVNDGIIWNCSVNDSNIEISVESDLLNKHLYAYAGGIVGECNGIIKYCNTTNTAINPRLERNYDCESDASNSTSVYAGGIAAILTSGYISYCYIDGKTSINAYASSVCKDSFSTRHPHVTVKAAGIVPFTYDESMVENVYNNSTGEIKTEYHKENKAVTGDSIGNNCTAKNDAYVVGVDEQSKNKMINNIINQIPDKKVKYNFSYFFTGEYNEQYNCFESQLYECGEDNLKLENLKINLGTTVIDYSLITYYGFDTINPNLDSAVEKSVTLIIAAEIGGQVIIAEVKISIVVKENEIDRLEIIQEPSKIEYEMGENISLDGGVFRIIYKDNSFENVTDSVRLLFDNFEMKYGKNEITVIYEEYSATYNVYVQCIHDYSIETLIKPTCERMGYTLHTCSQCGEHYKSNLVDKLAHETELHNVVENSCTTTNYSGDEYCILCEKYIKRGEELPMLEHKFENCFYDSANHYCTTCGKGNGHLYETIECELEVICSCIFCDYTTKYDVNDRDKIAELPRIVVSDAYSLEGKNEVVVYLELYANVGITSASFSVYFGNDLKLVDFSYGNILYQETTTGFEIYDDHMNVSLCKASTEMLNQDYSASNTLLKLVFETPEDASVDDEYLIKVVNRAEKVNGQTVSFAKFTNSKGQSLDFLAIDGKIKIVDRLPGDVIGDGTIDILDALIVNQYFVFDERKEYVAKMEENYENFDISYGDVDLDGSATNSDVVQILRYIVGGYEARVLAKQFNIKFNLNDGTGREIIAKATCDENGTITISDIPEVSRDGYKFDDWHYGFAADSNVLDGEYKYDHSAYEQVLYAHYTLNTISFDGNGGTAISDVTEKNYYNTGEKYTVTNIYKNNSLISFDTKCDGLSQENKEVSHDFLGWSLNPNGEVKYSPGYVFDLKNGEIGNLKLYAIWSTESIDLPSLSRIGYTFNGWATSDGIKVGNSNERVNISDDIKFIAQWNIIQFSLKYDGNYGFGYLEDKLELRSKETEQTKLEKNVFTREGYKFVGWNTKANGSGISYSDEAVLDDRIFEDVTDNSLILYAQWEGNKYTIIYNSNGGYGSMQKSYHSYGTQSNLLSNTFERTGYGFTGWTDQNGIYYNNRALVNMCVDDGAVINLYARWAALDYLIYYDSMGGSVATTKKVVTYDSRCGILETPYRANYIFLGWYTDKNYSNRVISDTIYTYDSNITLYACWVSYVGTWSSSGETKITASDNYYQDVTPSNFDRNLLKSLAYTKVEITISLNVKEKHDGWQEIWLYGSAGNQIGYEKFEHGPGYKNDSYGYHNITITVDINDLTDIGGFKIKYGAQGGGYDDWYVNERSVTIKAIQEY